MKKYSIVILWLIFTGIFLGLGIFHIKESENKIAHFQISKRPLENSGSSAKFFGRGIDEPLKDFNNDFNSYLDLYNESARKQNEYAAYGYFAAALTSIFSAFSSWKSEKSRKK